MSATIERTENSVEFPADTLQQIEKAAREYGLQPASYLMLLHAVRSGEADASLLESVREIFTRDREILKELAK